jgi:hypothetical protein
VAAHVGPSRHQHGSFGTAEAFADPERAEADLAGRRLACPSCRAGRLAPWAYARAWVVSLLAGRRAQLTPRRARCTACRRTHVLLASWCVPRRGHGVEVVATALAGRLRGRGHRGIAQLLGVPAGTYGAGCSGPGPVRAPKWPPLGAPARRAARGHPGACSGVIVHIPAPS